MKGTDIEKVRREANRLSALCREALDELGAMEYGDRYYSGTKTSGALRRASLDLTRSLAEMRKP